MIEARATVESVAEGRVRVRAHRALACSGCAAPSKRCACALLSEQLAGQRPLMLDLPYTGCVRTGDEVVLGLAPAVFSKTMWAAYGGPLAGLIAGAVVAGMIMPHDTVVLAGAIAGLASGLAARRRLVRGRDPEVHILRVATGQRMQSPAA